MKRIFSILIFLCLIILPVSVYAYDYLDYNTSVNKAASYITKGNYANTHSKYIKSTSQSHFITKKEFESTKDQKEISFLFDGVEIWTSSSDHDGQHYVINYKGQLEEVDDSKKYKSRDAEYVDEHATVVGRGSYANPWTFEPMYEVKVKTDERYGYIQDGDHKVYTLSAYVVRGDYAEFTLGAKSGFIYITNNCNASYSEDSGVLRIANIKRNLSCKVVFGTGKYKVTLNEARPSLVYLKYRDNFYSNDTYKNIITRVDPPTKTGYTFIGYKYNDLVIVNEDGSLNRSVVGSISENITLNPSFKINAPEGVTIEASGNAEKVYNKDSTTLTCNTATNYESGTTINYQFGFSTSLTDTITWLSSYTTSKTYVINKDEFAGVRYYACRVRVSYEDLITDDVVSDSRVSVSYANPRVDFDGTANGGTHDGSNTLYVKYGGNTVYTSRSNITATGVIPKSKKTGYNFDGWYTAVTGGIKVIDSGGNLVSGANNYTNTSSQWIVTGLTDTAGTHKLYAQFKAAPLTFGNQTLNSGVYATTYTSNAFTAATSGTGSYTYSIKSGAPSGATINSTNRTISFTNTTNAGTYNVVVLAKDNNSGVEKEATMTIVINKILATLTCSNKNYSGSEQTGCSCSGGTVGGTYKATNAGTYTAKCTGDNNHTDPVNQTWTINKVAATLSCSNKTYTGSAQTGCTCSGGTVGGTYSATNVGTYTASCTADSNHTSPSNATWKINQKAVTITAKAQTISYGSSIATGTSQITTANLISGHTVNAITLTASTSNITTSGTITPSAATIKDGSGNVVTNNYSITYNTGTLTITKVAAVITCSDKTYTGEEQTACSCSGGSIGGTYKATNAGTYTATCTGDANHTNATNKTWTISKKAASITARGQTINYGESIATGVNQINTTILITGHTITSVTLNASTTNATNSGTITPSAAVIKNSSGTDVTSNYNITYNTGTLVINKVNATLTCSDKTYTGSSQTACTYSGCSSVSGTSGTNAGTYTAKCTGDANHNSPNNVTWEMKKIDSTISCSDKTYNGSEQTACSCSGGTIGGAYKATNVGSYTATCTGDTNHNNAENKVWTMKQKAVTITAKNQSINYGGSISTGTGQITSSGLISGHTVSNITLTPSTSSATTNGTIAPSSATIKNSGGTAITDNYVITYVNGTLTINQVPAQLTCSDKTYNGNAQTGCTCSGGTIGGTFKATNVGTYTASCTGDANHSNPSNKTWRISTDAATLSCSNKTYNGSSQTACTYSGCSSVTNVSGTNAGSYTATCTPDANHSAPSNVSWTMNKKALTITAKNQTFDYGGSLATGTGQITSSGLVSGHSITSITLTPSTTNATTSGKITPSAAVVKNSGGTEVTGNYAITYNKGDLVINKIPARIDCTDKTYTGSSQTGCSCSGGTIGGTYSATNVGTYTAACTGDTNHYNPDSKTWKINQKTLTCPSSPAAKTYNGSSQASGITCPSGSSAGNNTSATNAGSYSQTCTADSNHKFSAACSVSWKINKVNATVKAKDQTILNGGSISTGTSYVTVTGLLSGHSITSVTLTQGSNNIVPSAAVFKNGSGSVVTGNYNITYTNGSLNINYNKAVITCSDKTYNGSQQTGCTCSGGTIGGTYKATNAGTYTAKCTGDATHNDADDKQWKIIAPPAELKCSNKSYSGSEQVACTCTNGTIGGTYKATNAGTYTASCTANTNYSNPSNVSWTMSTIPAKLECTNQDYTGSTITGCTCSGGTVGGTFSAIAAGDYTASCTGDSNHTNPSNKTWSITKIPAKLNCSNKKYTGSEQTGCTCSGGSIGGTYKATNVGTYTASCAGDNNHTNPANKEWSISKDPNITATITCSNKTYNGSEQTACTCSGGTIGGTYKATNAGTYTATCTGDANHSNAASKSWTMSTIPADLRCSNKTYSGSSQTACTCTGGTVGGTYYATNAGTYTASCTGDSNHSNPSNVQWTMNKYTLTCPSSPAAKNYTGSSQASGISCPSGSSAGGSTSATNAGTYYQSCTPGTNYQFSATCSVSWIIKTIPANITCSNKIYTGSAQTGCTCSGGTIGGNYSATNVGTYSASCTGDVNHSNPSNKSWSITAKTIRVNFYRNTSSSDTSTVYQDFTSSNSGNRFGYNNDGTPKWTQSGQFGQWDKTGYTLLGWSTSKTATSATYSVYSGVTVNWINTNEPSINLYAVWQAKSVTVTFHKNDGGTSTASQTFTYGASGNRFGYKTNGDPQWSQTGQFGQWDWSYHLLLGWAKSSSATAADYSIYSGVSDNWINNNSPSVDLYAVWREWTKPCRYEGVTYVFYDGYASGWVCNNPTAASYWGLGDGKYCSNYTTLYIWDTTWYGGEKYYYVCWYYQYAGNKETMLYVSPSYGEAICSYISENCSYKYWQGANCSSVCIN